MEDKREQVDIDKEIETKIEEISLINYKEYEENLPESMKLNRSILRRPDIS